jgi:hypothetical protein
VQLLADEMKSDGVMSDVCSRVREMVVSRVEEEYEHPADSALAAYLWLLSTRDGDYSTKAAETVLGCKQCWWARKMAEHVQSQKKPEKDADKSSPSPARAG